MKMNWVVSLILIALLLHLEACTVMVQDPSENFRDKRPASSRLQLVDESLDEALKSYYKVTHCISHEAYVVEDEICMNYSFSSDVTKSEIETLLTAYTNYVVQGTSPIGYSPYAAFDGYGSLNQFTLRFFIEDEILFYKSYTKSNNRFETFENTGINLACRQLDTKASDHYLDQFKKSGISPKNIRIMNPLTPYVSYIAIEHPRKDLKENELLAYEAQVENLVSSEYPDSNKLAYVLEVWNKGNQILSSQSYILSQRKWVEGDWMNMDYFSMQ